MKPQLSTSRQTVILQQLQGYDIQSVCYCQFPRNVQPGAWIREDGVGEQSDVSVLINDSLDSSAMFPEIKSPAIYVASTESTPHSLMTLP